jgi:hypothetical protein
MARRRRNGKASRGVVLLSGGNPQIAKADGDVPVQAYIAAMPGWKRGLGKRLDALIVRNVPNVRKAVKWNSPIYGIEGQGWFLGFHVFTHYVKVTFFRGTSLRPVPPGGTGKDVLRLGRARGSWPGVHLKAAGCPTLVEGRAECVRPSLEEAPMCGRSDTPTGQYS